MYYKACLVCGKEFETRKKTASYCGRPCRAKGDSREKRGYTLWSSPFGRVWQRLDGNGYFYVRDSSYPFEISRGRLRRANWVYWKVTGQNTAGYHVHHKDHNKQNDAFENLVKLTPKQHGKDAGKYTDKVRQVMSAKRRAYEGEGVCEVCGKQYKMGSTTGLYCSKTCADAVRNAARRKGSYDRECPVCHTTFNTNLKQTYCSKDCKCQADNAKRNEKRRKEVGFKLITSHCEVCGQPYEHNINRPKKTCSQRCAFKAWYIKQK